MSETKLFKELFSSVMFGHFSGRAGGLPNSKLFEELFFLSLDFFSGRGGGYLIPKLLRNFSAYILEIFEGGGGYT